MIYLDNASTTNKKPLCVKLAVKKALSKKYCANPGRSSHNYSINAAQVIYETRENLNIFFGGYGAENVVFTSGCTEALNLAILGTLKKGGHVVYTTNEHNSVARPLEYLKNKKIITTTLVQTNINGIIEPSKIEEAITDKTYLVIVNHTSNVTGATSNIKKIGEICKQKNVMLLVDTAQSAGHQKIDMKDFGISMLAVAGHKGLLACQGVGALLFNGNIEIKPQKFGGTGTNSELLLPPVIYPDSLEAGTSPTPAIFSLNAGVKYISKNFDKINKKISKLTKYLLDELYKKENLKIYTAKNCFNGVVSFRINNVLPSEVVNYFNQNNICIRSGLHCAPLCHKKLGTIDGGTIRVSISSANHKWEIKKFIKLLDKFLEQTK
ncbi:MAG TPA: cysteine desulfurase [Clostridiales bacterium]|nr:cysteine desulfurase [Clostridiales bacterium]